MRSITFHCHPIPIARSNLLYCELEVVVPYQPASKQQSQTSETPRAKIVALEIRVPVTEVQVPKVIVCSRPKINADSLNRADENEIRQYNNLLTARNRHHLQNVRKKLELYPQRYGEANYVRQSQILLLSPGWSSAERYSCCSIRGGKNPSGACYLHRFCPYCSYLTGRDVQLSLVPAYSDGNWFFITGSYRGSLPMPTLNSAFDWLQYYDAYKSALDRQVADEAIRGYYFVEELAVNHLQQVDVLPHIHAVVDCDGFSDEMVLEVGQTVLSDLDAHDAELLVPAIDVEPIQTQRSLMDHLRYMFKPINLVRPYSNDWQEHCSSDRRQAVQLNSNTTDVVLGYSHTNYRRNKMQCKGTLNSRCNEYIGVAKSERNRYKPLLKELQAEADHQYIEQAEVEDDELNCALN